MQYDVGAYGQHEWPILLNSLCQSLATAPNYESEDGLLKHNPINIKINLLVFGERQANASAIPRA
jgi:hypothetical protein